ncbi:MAG: NIPSNAP family protein [Planctomycetaceae bacterium]|jgi:hypothetical protein|nr:NIPSNAP family protein [Planctomycetaceae bacterium]
MKRRDFLKTAGTAACAAGTTMTAGTMAQQSALASESPKGKAIIELRVFTCANAEKKQKLIEIFDAALIPALNRQGIEPVGLFETNAELNDGDKTYDQANDLKIFLVTQFMTTDQLIQVTPKLLADEKYLKDAAPIFEAPMNDPVYDTSEASLLLGFDHFPRIEVPSLEKDRVLQIRLYNSYNIERNARKIDMFDVGGEIALFRKYGMLPVFYGETLAGRMMPNLTYMLSFKNMEEKVANWQKFATSSEWKTLSGNPLYKNTANKILNILLKPTPKSQI